jgi:plasmid maintenance system antidote protein VapI
MVDSNYTVAPGAYLDEWMERTASSVSKVSISLEVPLEEVRDLIHGDVPITRIIADRLEALTGIPVDAWERYERKYRNDSTRLSA